MRPLEVLAEPNRRRILDVLRTHDCGVNEIADALRIRQPSASKHLKVLRDAGLVTMRPDAQRRVYCLRAEPLRELDEWLAPYRAAWAERIDALERHLDAIDPQTTTEQQTTTDPSDTDQHPEDPS